MLMTIGKCGRDPCDLITIIRFSHCCYSDEILKSANRKHLLREVIVASISLDTNRDGVDSLNTTSEVKNDLTGVWF